MAVSALAAVARLRANVPTRQLPQGMCLNFVWRMFGSLNSTGYAAGTLTTAYNAWLHSRDKHPGSRDIPVGAPVYFGPSPTRTDKNKNAGDVMIHVGNGIIGGTDVNGANTGYMTIDARARQIARPYLGWTGDFGGRPIDFGHTESASVIKEAIKAVEKEQQVLDMFVTYFQDNRGSINLTNTDGKTVEVKPGDQYLWTGSKFVHVWNGGVHDQVVKPLMQAGLLKMVILGDRDSFGTMWELFSPRSAKLSI